MTDVQPYRAPATPPAHSLVDWAREADAAWQIADKLVHTSFCPDAYRNKPTEGAAAIMAGGELGLSPIAALNAFDPIKGKPAPKAITLRAVAQSRGHQFRLVESTENQCIVEAQRAGSDVWNRFVWSIDRARKLGLTNKDQWQRQPTAMLLARATAEAARFVAADALLGIPHAAEELDESEPVATRTISRRRALEPVPPPAEPELDDTAPTSPETAGRERVEEVALPEVEPESPTEAMTKKMWALLTKRYPGDEKAQRFHMARVVDHAFESSKELHKGEVALVIDSLEPAEEPPLEEDDAATEQTGEVVDQEVLPDAFPEEGKP